MSLMQPLHPFVVTPDTVPQTEAEFLACLASWDWRIFSGLLYKITTKDDDDDGDPGEAIPFRPNIVQRLFLANIHTRNIILKARQLGFSTLIEILALDHALFNANQEVVVIAQTSDAASKLYRKKVQFAYDNLPADLKAAMPTLKRTETQMVFANGSSIEVTTSARGGTPHFLHISEFGKIAATNPGKATEITTGSLQGVPKGGFVFIESTAEGNSGAFHAMSKKAERLAEAKTPLSPLEYRFHFFAWWHDPGYRLPIDAAKRTRISSKEHEYFDSIEGKMDVEIDLCQRAWYISKRDADFISDPDLMWREFPSTPEECWQTSTEGKYLAKVMAIARKHGRIGIIPIHRHVPVNSFWDLGSSDDTCIWLHQRIGQADNWIGFTEGSGQGYLHFLLWIERHDYLLGEHFLPHDAVQKRQQAQNKPSDTALASPEMILRGMRPSWTWRIVPRVQNIQHGIDLMRHGISTTYWFHEENCKEGLAHLEAYSREWNTRLQVWHDHPRHDEHSHAPDALRQHAQAFVTINAKLPSTSALPRRKRPDGMTA